MNILEFDKWCRSFLEIDAMERADASLNGLQVGEYDRKLTRVAFAVDACLETLEKAAEEGADLLFVHHGLFWGRPLAVIGDHFKRVMTAMDNDLALYAVHLPLDMHPEYGNNAGLADILGLKDQEGFGEYKGFNIGIKGRLETALKRDELVPALFGGWEHNPRMLPFGPSEINTVAIISGGGTHEVSDAIKEGVDLYITGDSSHQIYHQSLEAGINVLFGGHYLTELTGVQSIQKKVEEELKLETIFIDVPTGL
ncbi:MULTISPECIES: Nif3-like dinuclear metal center hexameric protein [unclassified Oceanispirochaeta]|uniref:Nif3-like dinuclear metal center hexameric protein n=1 Tax=unclassified Oceanispirochaeta TaxID=2635722 RepID=UPI000E091282|nr:MULTISPECIES: Nif3-like dinuclear metal center hexameric protein [unclassified Oceanispirochaeta]MBF9015391.1 Nif3-like dinuclear metal center hexameric protein [Oceanispirochaeta sp. M2]NPD71850.1 Nif3-like dinuclear metal center hexameric protein [Oceanispirochaeta sp. M1]RDG32660.1 Nif3-like dinuclear metal center hexameric protein [Oceanispirochaeta sp. M1]